jgi:acetyl esterase/lipase
VQTTYTVYRQQFVYGAAPFLITDTRTEARYSDKESYETRGLTVYRAHDNSGFLHHQPVVFFVHGGAWIDEYENWYDFVAQSFTGAKGWVTVVIDYRLTSDQVFVADEHCPDRTTCALPENVAARTKAAWYRDNIEDVAAAFRWTLDRCAEAGGNPRQVVVFGHSAGGHLASLLTTHPSYADLRPGIRGLVSMSGAYALEGLNPAVFGSALDQTFHGGHQDNSDELAEASPATYVTSEMALPPAYLLHAQGELPSLSEQTLGFKTRLETAGAAVRHDYLAGYTHTTEMEAIADVNAEPTALIVAFIEEVLGLGGPHRVWLPLALGENASP